MVDDQGTLADAVSVAHEVVWCVLTTVDARGRPRNRVVLSADHDVAYLDCTATWATREERHHAWDVCRAAAAPAGFDPATIWADGPDSPGAEVLRLDPYRVQVGLAADLAAGGTPRLWRSVGHGVERSAIAS